MKPVMRRSRRVSSFAAACVLSLLLAAPVRAAEPPAAAAAGAGSIDLYVRKAGSGPRGEAEGFKSFALDTLPLEEVKHRDVQYESVVRVRGIRLAALISRYAPPPATDVAILHFANGMAVPLPFRDGTLMKRLDPFVARALVAEPGAPAPDGFPPISRRVENYVDVRPIVFTGNKLAVADRMHPDVPEKHRAVFSPWTYVDSLRSIEFVSGSAYYRQFDLDPASHDGFVVFSQSCQFCHGARKGGASLGWDFVEPEPIVNIKRSPRALFFHVRYRGRTDQINGAQMPALTHVDEEDARKLHGWLKALADKDTPEYAP